MRRSTSVLAALVLAAAATAVPAQIVRQATDDRTVAVGPGAMDDAGTVVWAGSSSDVGGSNPEHAFQLVRFDPVSGVVTHLTNLSGGASLVVSVSDDGQWLAFPSPADITGQNHDRSIELFVMRSDGTGAAQLTNDPAPNAGSVSAVAIAGSGNRVAFVANTDPLGTNPSHRTELFVVDRDGTALRQLTQTTSGSLGGVGISDDGTRLVFSHSGDLTGGNADLGSELFAVNADGTGLRQLTSSPAGFGSGSPALSGNGQKIAFQSNANLTGGNAANQEEIFAIDWNGTGLRQLTTTTVVIPLLGDPAALSPSITDDGLTVVYYSNYGRLFPPVNLDGNYEVFKIRTDGTGLTALTSTALQGGSVLPTIAGGGGRITYYGIDTSSVRLQVMDGNGGSKRDLQTFTLVLYGAPEISPGGTRAVFTRSTGLFDASQVFRVDTDGTGLAQVTALASGSAATPSIAADDDTIVFSANSDPTGGNGDLSEEIFSILADGTGIAQISSGASGTASQRPAIADAGGVVVFDSDADLTGANADLSREVFAVTLGGAGPVQLTNGVAGTESRAPRVDAGGTWVVFESNADMDGGNADGSLEIWRVRADGTGLQRITGSATADSESPDLSSDGGIVSFESTADFLGTNPEGNREIWSWEAATSTLRQLTVTAAGSSSGGRISGAAGLVWFGSTAPIFESDPDDPFDLYRVPATGGAVERVGALRAGALVGAGLIGGIGGSSLSPNDAGTVAVFTGLGDFTGTNRDLLPEIWVIDRDAPARIEVGKPAPTLVSWPVESGPVRYDVVRGDLAALSLAGGVSNLGAVVCLENDSPDADTLGFEDAVEPEPGRGFFFLYRGSPGLLAGPGSYGRSAGGLERTPSAGDCP